MAEKKGFDLASVLGEVSNLDTSIFGDREQIEYIDIDLIEDDPNNFYALTDLEALSSNIQLCGLQQPIRVRTGDGGRVTIVSGHRRRAALRLLTEEGLEQFRSVPCIRERDAGSPALQELRLIYANSDTRKLTSPEIAKQAERVEMLLYQLKEDGYEFPGRMRDHVAEACNVSKSKLARLKVIREKLIPSYQAIYESGRLVEQAAYALAGMPAEFQERCAKVLKEAPHGSSAENIRDKLESGCSYDPSFTCPDGTVCHHGDAFLRHDFKCGGWALCGGEKCCLDCREAFSSCSACESACSKVKSKRKENAEQEKLRSEKETNRRISEAKSKAEYAAEFVKRMHIAAEAAGIQFDKKLLESVGVWTYDTGHILNLLSGEYNVSPYDDARQRLPRIDALAQFCRKTGCSADFILGLSE